ncbi:MAG: response regulator [Chloroflexi bacterium]|nr:response regulator [Chloroflexota bacterium]
MSKSGPHFLYVEDDLMSRKVLEVLLIRVMGFTHVTIFDNSENFMDQLRLLPDVPGIFLLDIQMRPHDGYEVLEMLRNDPIYQNSIVIALTANVMANDVQQLQSVGFDGLIGKPIMKDIFPDLIEKILSGESVWYVP